LLFFLNLAEVSIFSQKKRNQKLVRQGRFCILPIN